MAAAVVALGVVSAPSAEAATTYDGLTTTEVVGGLTLPVNLAFADSGRIYVAEKAGLVKLFDGPGDTSPVTALDLRTDVYDHWDRGLLGVALDPAFDTGKPYLYVLYTWDRDPFGDPQVPRWGGAGNDACPSPPGATDDGCTASGKLERYTVGADGVANPASRVVLLDGAAEAAGGWCQQFPSHSVGEVAFGPDGMLYVSHGDGASFNAVDYGQFGGKKGPITPVNPCADGVPRGTAPQPATSVGGALRSQAVRSATADGYVSWDGAILRVDPATGKAPADNPLVDNGIAGDDRIVAYGLRNPYRFGFRPDSTELWLGDVGWSTFEEINSFTTGPGQTQVPNFGWPCFEGPNRAGAYDNANLGLCESLYQNTSSSLGGVASPLVAPKLAWPRSGSQPAPECASTGGGSATGGAFVTNDDWPAALHGAYVFADYSRGCIAAMPLVGGTPQGPAVTLANGVTAVAIKSGPGGDLYYVDISKGTVNRLRSSSGNQPPAASFTATPATGQAPLEVTLDASASSDPDGAELLSFGWDLDGDGACDDATGARVTHTFTAEGTVAVTVCVTDQLGAEGRATRDIVVGGNTAPAVTVDSPAEAGWAVGDDLSFTAVGTDAEDGDLPDSAYAWRFEIRHCSDEAETTCHPHFLSSATGPTATIEGPDHEWFAYVIATVTVTDSDGATASASLPVKPRTSVVNLATEPSGIEATLGTQGGTTPLSQRFLEGGQVQIIVPDTATVDGQTWTFAGWSDGADVGPTRTMAAPAGTTSLTATYDPPVPADTPPKVTDVKVSPTSVRVGILPEPFSVRAKVADDSRVTRVVLRVTEPDGSSHDARMTRVRGTSADGTWQGYGWISRHDAPGTFRVQVIATDDAGQSTTVAGQEVQASRKKCFFFICW